MFGILKKKITGFIDKLTKKEEERVEETISKEEVPKKVGEKPEEIKEKPDEKKEVPEKPKEVKKKEMPKEIKKVEEKPKPVKEKPIPEKKESVKKIEEKKEEPVIKKEIPIPKKEQEKPVKKQEKVEPIKIIKQEKPPEKKEIIKQEKVEPEIKEKKSELAEEKPKQRIKLSPFSMIKSFVTQEVEINEKDIGEMLDELELELLEGDVDMDVAEAIKNELTDKLIGQKIKKKELNQFIKKAIKQTLIDILSNENSFDIIERLNQAEKPFKIMFLGTNGAGKTTTIAKFANLVKSKGHKVVFAAADTFRAAAIEQMGVHADRLDVKLVKRDYGSDPTSVAYDAVNYAKSHSIDVVMIDTAGRQDTNINLINELKKMNRVIKPDLKIYVGESIAGNAILEQVKTFHKEIGIDGVVLTKLDCDPKGGTMLSINKSTGVPIVYIGTGQKYEDIELFDPETMANRIVE